MEERKTMRLAEAAGRAFDRLLDACAWIGCAMLAFQVVSVSVEIICRYFFDISFSVITPLNEWSLVYLTFVGAAWLQREGGHTSDDSIVTLLPPWVDWAARRLGWVLAIVTCGLLTWYGDARDLGQLFEEHLRLFQTARCPDFLRLLDHSHWAACFG